MWWMSLLLDILHDILEGVLQYKVKLMLQMMIGVYFTLENFNCYMEEFELGYMEVKDRPTLLTQNNLQSKGSLLKQKVLLLKSCE